MPRFPQTWCSSCGEEFGPGDSGYSHCEDHEDAEMRRWWELYKAEKRAGLTMSREEYERTLRDAGRGHLIRER